MQNLVTILLVLGGLYLIAVGTQRLAASTRRVGNDGKAVRTKRDWHAEVVAHRSEKARLTTNLAGHYRRQGDYTKAKPLYEDALRIREDALGADHPDVAASLSNLARLHQAQGEYTRAVPLYERALSIYERARGAEHPDVAAVLCNLAGLLDDQGAYARAEALYERARSIYERVFGGEHPDVATTLLGLAANHDNQGRYERAEALCRQALCIYETALGPEDPAVATAVNNLAMLRQTRGAYAEAELLYDRALRIEEKALGPEHPQLATSLNNLAGLHHDNAAHAKAETLYTRALQIREKALGPEHPDVAAVLNNLAMLYNDQGAYARATSHYVRALTICETTLGIEHPHVSAALNNLGRLYQDQGAYTEAAQIHKHALRISEIVLGFEHRATAVKLNNLAAVYRDQGEYAEAKPLYERALHICEQAFGPEHVDVATVMANLARLHAAQGDHAQAEGLYQRALRVYETTLGADHPGVATLLHRLALVCWSRGDVARALRYFVRAGAILERHILVTFPILGEKRKRQFLHTVLHDLDVLVSFHAHGAPDDIGALALVLTATLQRKGRVLAEVVSTRTEMRRSLSPLMQSEFDAVQARRSELAARHEAAGGHTSERLDAIALEVEQLEDALSRKSAEFRRHTAPLQLESIQASIAVDATLVEFVRYQRYDPSSPGSPWQEARYVAYLLQHEGSPRWVALGNAELIETAVLAAHRALATPGSDARGPLRALDELIFAPIRRRLATTRHFLLAPDAALHLVPFAALVDDSGHYLIERALISYVTSGRDLVRPDPEAMARSKPLVIAAPELADRAAPLPGAEAEAAALGKHFTDVDLYVGAHATREKLTEARGPAFVHIATHGFVRAGAASASRPAGRCWRDERDLALGPGVADRFDKVGNRPDIEDALDDAGLLFTGTSDTSGVLTAREIAAIDLHGTKLIVLSACDTGSGELAKSEGIYGLRRAVAIAGAQAQVVSLWKIDDSATSHLMDRYYGELRRGAGRSEALQRTQLEMLHGRQHAHPFYWAAFVHYGDEGPLSGG
jgi:CHAT domain-containing protein/tetratricopeptide (TPR) repeat protein